MHVTETEKKTKCFIKLLFLLYYVKPKCIEEISRMSTPKPFINVQDIDIFNFAVKGVRNFVVILNFRIMTWESIVMTKA